MLALIMGFAMACSGTEADVRARVDAELKDAPIACLMSTLQAMTPTEKSAFMKVGLITEDKKVTEKGQKYFKRGLFCYGDLSVEKINSMTDRSEPSVGMKATEVKFTAKLVNVADWATDPEIEKAFSGIKRQIVDLSKPHERRKLLVEGKTK